MSKHYSKKRRLKYVFLALACTASFSITGLAAACKTEEKKDETDKTTSKEDVQLLKNGNFVFFNVPDKKDGQPAPEYLINTPSNWTKGGTSSYTMSGIIGTSDKAWEKLTASNLAERLDANNALDSTASNYKEQHIDFNGMKSSDLLYKDSYGALKYGTISSETDSDDKTKYYIGEDNGKTEIYFDEAKDTYYYDAEKTRPITKDLISNPQSHNIIKEEGKEPYYLDDKGEKQKIFTDENGDYYLEYDEIKKEYRQPVGHVLMLHNYSNSTHNGIAQNYASVEVSLPANTSAEISVWVKTSNLLFSQGLDVNDDQDHGANITVTHSVGSSSLDDFAITSINTEKLIGDGKASSEYNGWVEYTVYVNSCNFASSTVTLKLGLGDTDNPVEGYAFFDDVSITKYKDLDKCSSYTAEVKNKIESDGAKCDLRSDASEKIFVADTYERNGGEENGGITEDRFSESFHYLLDLASESGYESVNLQSAKAGLTVDSDKYTSSLNTVRKLNLNDSDEQLKVKLPEELKNLKGGKGLDTKEDLLALVDAGYKFTETQYNDKLNEALASAADLNSDTDNKTLVLFSARGAAYTASFDLTIEEEGHKIISFWVKTSDMNGSTAATVKITEEGNKDNSANVTLDSTGIVTDIDDKEENKDVFKGWVQCFFFVHNDTKKVDGVDNPATLRVEFSFGNTTLNGTTVTSYKAGWAALTNVQELDVDEDIFAYTGSGNYTTSLTITEDEKKTTSKFDEVYGNQAHEIESNLVDPATYFGTNGASSKVVNNGVISPFDDKNPNDWAGLLNKEYFVNKDGKYEGYTGRDWYQPLLNSFNVSSTDALANWNDIFGAKSVQPLIIVNKLREGYVQLKSANENNYKAYWYYDEDNDEYVKVGNDDEFDKDKKYFTKKDVLNYGFIGEEKTVSADGFTTVSVKVKVSAGAVAYIYLVDTTDSSKVLGFDAPSYSFWYDKDGNVLKSEIDEKANLDEQRANVLYSLRDDGLYEDENGKLFANTWNYSKLYSANITYYTKDGEFSVDDLKEGVTYYKDKACTVEADHYLVTSESVKLYEYKDGKYYYIVKGETQKDEITPFDRSFARYDYSESSERYTQVIEDTHGEWVTINYVLHAGSASKNYRLELWSGARDEFITDGNTANGSVLFDYSYTSVSSDDLLNEYENEIIRSYQKILAEKGLLNGITTSTENIEYYKNLVDENVKAGKITQADIDKYEILKNYTAHYYAYSLYDSADFQPFNKEAADKTATGYDYSADGYEEKLAYLSIKDGNNRTVFTDYSTIDQSITLDLGTSDEDTEEEDKEEEKTDNANVWLLASSIILVVALIFAMIAIFIKDALKKNRRKKVFGKNSYDTNKTNRYIRKLGIKKEEIEEVDAPAVTPAEPEQPAEDTNEQSEVEEQTEEPVETAEPEQTEEQEESSDKPDDVQE